MKHKNIVKRITKQYSRALMGLAHYDVGKKVLGCDCCFCSPNKKESKNGR